MNLLRALTLKLGKPVVRKQGEELIFTCPRCHRDKLWTNIRKGVFHCVRCGNAGLIKSLLGLPVSESDLAGRGLAYLTDPDAWFLPKTAVPIASPIPDFVIGGTGNDIIPFCQNKGISLRTYLEKGWGISGSPKLRGRLIIPIVEEGKTVSYVARSVDGRKPKEISGPNKGQYLYGIDDFPPGTDVVIVEGIFDCEAVKRAYFHSVALLGSSISDIQLGKLLSTHPTAIILMLDGDDAGRQGTRKIYKKLIARTHVPIRMVVLPEGKDPDDLTLEELRSELEG